MFTLNTLTGNYWQGPPPIDAPYLYDQNARNMLYDAKGLRYRAQLVDAVVTDNRATAADGNNAQAAQAVPQGVSLVTLALIGIGAYLLLK